jgi:diguanylate cyclase (GGDEF)-like protein
VPPRGDRRFTATRTLTPIDAERPHPLILVADSDAAARATAAEELGRLGFEVREAAAGREALDAIRVEAPDLIIVGGAMPVREALDVCIALRVDARFAHLPVLFVTERNDAEAANLAYEAGASDFAFQPTNWPLFAQRLRFLLRHSRTVADLRKRASGLGRVHQIAQFGHWEADAASGEMLWSPEVAGLLNVPPKASPTIEDYLAAVHPDDLPTLRNAIDAAVASGRPFALDHRLKDTHERFVHTRADVSQDGSRGTRLVGTIQDVTERVESQHKIRYLAFYDSLTNLPNRRLFTEILARLVERARRQRSLVAVLFLDLDNFKRVNDTFGHATGDRLLKVVGERLSQTVRRDDILARPLGEPENAVSRLGGDEFVVAFGGLGQAEDAARLASRMLEEIKLPIAIDKTELSISASVGISLFPHDGDNEETLLGNADAALYCAKDGGRNCVHFFDRSMNEAALQRQLLEGELRRSVARGEFVLHYQPQVDIATGRIRSAETFIRWKHADLGLVQPGDFLGAAEHTGLIHPIGQWVLADVVRQVQEWRDRGLPRVHVAINVSPPEFRRPDLAASMAAVVNDAGISPDSIELEITEATLMDNVAIATGVLARLKSYGFRIALDDFGVRASSLTTLKQWPIDVLKIDRAFIRNIATDAADAAVAGAIISLARNLRVEPVAEGVEKAVQRDALAALGCVRMQGFLFGRPEPAESFEERLVTSARAAAPVGVRR